MMLVLLNALMELCWMGAWASFMVSAIAGDPLPFHLLLTSFAAGSAAGFLFAERSVRNLWVVLGHASALCLCSLSAIHYFQFGPYPLFDTHWLELLFRGKPGIVHSLGTLLIFLCVFLVYIAGLGLIKRKKDHRGICLRFDIGVSSFFILFLVFFLMEARLGVAVKDMIPRGMVIPFFIFSLLAIGISANKGKAAKRTFSGPLGATAAFSIFILGLGTGLVMFLLPLLTEAARISYLAISTVAEPLGPVVMAVLRFMFQPRNIRTEGAGRLAGGEPSQPARSIEPGGWIEEAGLILAWCLALLLALAVALALATALWYLLVWLLSRTRGTPMPVMEREPIPRLLRALWIAAIRLKTFLMHRARKPSTARDFYLALQTWGRKAGAARRSWETPNEYASRLKAVAPSLSGDFLLLTRLFNEETYAGKVLREDETLLLKEAFARVKRGR
jgi:hypothetical protein